MNMEQSGTNLLVVDDEPAIRRVLHNSLSAVGYSVEEAASGEGALGAMERRRCDVVLLDINMPGIGGIETCRRIRKSAPGSGIIMISVRDGEDDKVLALESGADDYITKPFRFRELLARLRAVRRRMPGESSANSTLLRAGDLELDVTKRMFRKGGIEMRLSRREFDILSFLMSHQDMPIPHARLLKAVWGPEYGNETEYLRTYVLRLRKKIEPDAGQPKYILTEPWVGYRFRDSSASDTPSGVELPAAV
jgi:two-component system, OmpR family, KDP operon response regulator KdpE